MQLDSLQGHVGTFAAVSGKKEAEKECLDAGGMASRKSLAAWMRVSLDVFGTGLEGYEPVGGGWFGVGHSMVDCLSVGHSTLAAHYRSNSP